MRYIVIVFLLLVAIYLMSFAKYNWSKKNRTATIGVVLLMLVSIALPLVVMFANRG
ncbi:hypothetical protein Cpap_4021 [Ruminiclostridium papyrosolvens DSM 2782]|jgi:hypothetical protein|uniref:Uncharacterized protein n=1 Tax=Ruminiclostridium papyrosolvens DSM 2782 TaxID=588581 RepID=F1T7Y5_9FIRM|nr:hypothetical protein Cpap_4021 [Ruminiclostridium papyrosolvens DSM 2782]